MLSVDGAVNEIEWLAMSAERAMDALSLRSTRGKRFPMNPVEIAKGELIPMFESLVDLLEDERASEAAGFFRSVARSLGHAREEEDLADGFMRLSTSAFLGFRYSRSVATLLDRILESAQRLSHTLSVSEPQPDSHHSSN